MEREESEDGRREKGGGRREERKGRREEGEVRTDSYLMILYNQEHVNKQRSE